MTTTGIDYSVQVYAHQRDAGRLLATIAFSAAAPLCLLDVEEQHKIVVTARDRPVSTQVPGPCLL